MNTYNNDEFEYLADDKPINWREIFEKILFQWKWILLSIILFLAVGYVYVKTQRDVFQTGASLLVADQKGQMSELSLVNQLSSSRSYSPFNNTGLNNEVQVLKSTELMKRVVKDLELHTSYTHKKLLETAELYNNSPYYVRLDSASMVNLSSDIEFVITKKGNKFELKGKYRKNEFKKEFSSLPATLTLPAGQLTIIERSKPDERPITVTINPILSTARRYSGGNLSVSTAKNEDVINISVRAYHPQKAKDIVNTLIQVYNRDAIEQINRSALYTANFIDERLSLLSKELSGVETEIEQYKKTEGLTNVQADAQLFLQSNTENEKQRMDAEIQLQLIRYVEQFVNDAKNNNELIPNLGLTDPGLVAVVGQYNQLVLNRQRIAQGSSSDNPVLKNIDNQIASTRAALKSGISIARQGLQLSSKSIDTKNQQLRSRLSNIPRQEREILEVTRQQQVKQTLYIFLLQKREEASLSMAVAAPKGRLLNAPDFTSHVAPRSAMLMSIFLLLGLIIPIAIILLIDMLRTHIVDRADVEKITKIPVLGVLGHKKEEGAIIDHRSNATANSELFRLMRAKLQFALNYPQEKVLLVTSTESGEGKTFVSINLAVSLSLTEKKVLLIGMDLRKPMLTKYFNISDKEGVTSYLSGLTNDYRSMIHTSEEYKWLDILPAGIIPPNPNELIMRPKMDSMIDDLKKEYDYIVIDTAPVGAVSDTYLLDRVADLTIYVCRAGFTDKRSIEFVNNISDENNLKRLYLVINDVDVEARSRYGYYRKYGYGYGYGYGSKPDNRKK
jgi:capsular exopolysaccharide synthesis family protein